MSDMSFALHGPEAPTYVDHRFHVLHFELIEPSAYADDPVDYKGPGDSIPDDCGVKVNPECIKKC
jgi:hypothetical protein